MHPMDHRPPANPYHLPTTTVIARPKAVVTEGNASGAISCAIVQKRTVYQEIATSGYALLAMTW